jgi:hypothetical protein
LFLAAAARGSPVSRPFAVCSRAGDGLSSFSASLVRLLGFEFCCFTITAHAETDFHVQLKMQENESGVGAMRQCREGYHERTKFSDAQRRASALVSLFFCCSRGGWWMIPRAATPTHFSFRQCRKREPTPGYPFLVLRKNEWVEFGSGSGCGWCGALSG